MLFNTEPGREAQCSAKDNRAEKRQSWYSHRAPDPEPAALSVSGEIGRKHFSGGLFRTCRVPVGAQGAGPQLRHRLESQRGKHSCSAAQPPKPKYPPPPFQLLARAGVSVPSTHPLPTAGALCPSPPGTRRRLGSGDPPPGLLMGLMGEPHPTSSQPLTLGPIRPLRTGTREGGARPRDAPKSLLLWEARCPSLWRFVLSVPREVFFCVFPSDGPLRWAAVTVLCSSPGE